MLQKMRKKVKTNSIVKAKGKDFTYKHKKHVGLMKIATTEKMMMLFL